MRLEPPHQIPYTDLFIYYIKGRLDPPPDLDSDPFIGNWEEAGDSFLFFKEAADGCVARLLRRQPHLRLLDRFQMTYEEWQGGVQAPFQAGGLHVVPPWHPAAESATPMTIVMDPGVVFGTGTHPTTQDCLAALQLAFDHAPVHRVLDIGTGTGLLALAAARLGARQVLAVDLNRLAARTAQRNVHANRMAHQVLAVQGDALNFIDLASDLMVSNIHFAVMRRMIAAPGFSRHPRFILSGLMRSQAREVEMALRRQPVELLNKWERDGIWFTFYGRTKASGGSD